jgi:hypothetical protein
MAPSCLGAIKGTSRHMKENIKHTLNILDHSHSVFAHSIDILSDLSSVLVVNLVLFICAYCCGLVCVAFPTLTYVLLCDHLIVRARGSKLWRFLANGKE